MVYARIAAVMVLAAALLAACASAPPPVPDDDLAGTSWRFVELYGAPVTTPSSPEAREAELSFGNHGHLFGSDGCSRMLGSYTLEKDQITLREMAGMQMACLSTQESTRRLNEALKDAEHGSIEGTLLTLYNASGQTLAILERMPPRT